MSTVVKINNKLPSETKIKTELNNKLYGIKEKLKTTDKSHTITTNGKKINVLKELSKEFLNIIKDIFTKYISVPQCEEFDNNSIECADLKFKYYSMLKEVLSKTNILIIKSGEHHYFYDFYKDSSTDYNKIIEAEIYKFHSQIEKEIENYFNFKKINKEAIKNENSIEKIKSMIEKRIKIAQGTEIYIKTIKNMFNAYDSVTPCGLKMFNMSGYKKCEYNKVKYYTMLKGLLEKILENIFSNKPSLQYTNHGRSFKNYLDEKIKKIQSKIDKHKSRSDPKLLMESLVEKKNNKIKLQSGGKKTTKKTTIKTPKK